MNLNIKRFSLVFFVILLFISLFSINNSKTDSNKMVAYSAIEKITINKSVLTLSVGSSEKLSISVSPSDANLGDVVWISNNKKVVTIDDNGTVKGVGAGTGYIIAVSKDNYSIRSTCKVNVVASDTSSNNDNSSVITSKDSNTKVTKVVLSKNALDMNVGYSVKLSVSLLPVGSKSSVGWASSNEKVVTVDSDGTIKGISVGKAIVRVKAGSVTDDCVVTVESSKTKVFLNTLDRISKEVEKEVASGKKWKYGYKGHSGSFEKAKKNGNRKLTCIVLPSWALIEMGVLKSGQIVGNQKSGSKTYTWYKGGSDTKSRVKSNFKFISGSGKTAKTLINNGTLRAGDIVMWKHYHTSVYAGNHKWYDSGRVKTNGATMSKPYFKTFGPVSYSEGNKIRQILRFKQ